MEELLKTDHVKIMDYSDVHGEYISEMCDFAKEIDELPDKSCVEVVAQTGLGKTTSIKELGLKDPDRKILVLEPRITLLSQVKENIRKTDIDNIDTVSYQKLAADFIKSIELEGSDGMLYLNWGHVEKYLKYDIIVYDEHQVLLKDSTFNLGMLYVLKFAALMKAVDGVNIKQIFMTANHIPDKYNIVLAQCDYRMIFSEPSELYDLSDRVKDAYLIEYNQRIHAIVSATSTFRDDKHFIHVRSNKEAETLYEILNEYFPNEISLICSKNNTGDLQKYMKDSDVKMIYENELIPRRILISTSVGAYGISFNDIDLKHIHVNSYDPDDIFQVVGRKRLNKKDSGDKINLYFTEPNPRAIISQKNIINKMLKSYNLLKHDPIKFSKKKAQGILINTLHIPVAKIDSSGREYISLEANDLLYVHLKHQLHNIYSLERTLLSIDFMLRDKFKLKPISKQFMTDKDFLEKKRLYGLLLKRHEDGSIYKTKSDKDDLAIILGIKKNGKLIKSLRLINKRLEELSLPFKLSITDFYEGKTRYQSAWIIKK